MPHSVQKHTLVDVLVVAQILRLWKLSKYKFQFGSFDFFWTLFLCVSVVDDSQQYYEVFWNKSLDSSWLQLQWPSIGAQLKILLTFKIIKVRVTWTKAGWRSFRAYRNSQDKVMGKRASRTLLMPVQGKNFASHFQFQVTSVSHRLGSRVRVTDPGNSYSYLHSFFLLAWQFFLQRIKSQKCSITADCRLICQLKSICFLLAQRSCRQFWKTRGFNCWIYILSVSQGPSTEDMGSTYLRTFSHLGNELTLFIVSDGRQNDETKSQVDQCLVGWSWNQTPIERSCEHWSIPSHCYAFEWHVLDLDETNDEALAQHMCCLKLGMHQFEFQKQNAFGCWIPQNKGGVSNHGNVTCTSGVFTSVCARANWCKGSDTVLHIHNPKWLRAGQDEVWVSLVQPCICLCLSPSGGDLYWLLLHVRFCQQHPIE